MGISESVYFVIFCAMGTLRESHIDYISLENTINNSELFLDIFKNLENHENQCTCL